MLTKNQRAFTLIDQLVVLAILGFLSYIMMPRLDMWTGAVQVRIAAQIVAHTMGEARFRAIRDHENVAIKFREDADERVTLTLYRDGDGDGVRNRDIDSGVDEEIKAPRYLVYGTRRVRFGFPSGEAPTDPSHHGRRLTRLRDPIRFNNSDLASFDPLGTATPGTVYLTDGNHSLAAVRVNSRSSKVSILLYDRELERWRRL